MARTQILIVLFYLFFQITFVSKKLSDYSVDELRTKLETVLKVKLPKNMKEANIRDLANNKLHDTDNLFDNEKVVDGKIVTKRFKRKSVNPETCPMCSQKTLIKQPFPEGTEIHNSKYCSNCGYWDIPEKKEGSN